MQIEIPQTEGRHRQGGTGGIFAPSSPEISRRIVLKAGLLLGALAAGAGFARPRGRDVVQAQFAQAIAASEWIEEQSGPSQLIGSGIPIEVSAPFPFSSVGASWPADVGSWPIVELEVSSDGVNYSQVFAVGASAEGNAIDPGNRIHSPIVCAAHGVSVRYRTLDGAGNPAVIPGLALTFIDASSGPSIGEFPVSIAAKAGYDVSLPPALISRAEWGADETFRFEPDGEYWPREYRLVEHAIIHHSETPNAQDPLEAVRSIYYYHAVTRGWHDIGYNYLVDRFGNIYEGRAGGRNVIGGHAYEYAHGSVGICFIGEFFDDEVTEEALAAMVAILAWTCRDLDPLGVSAFHSEPRVPTICAHRDVNLSTCPGDKAYAELPVLRDLVAQTLANFDRWPAADLIVGDQVRTNIETGFRDDPAYAAPEMFRVGEFAVGVVIDGPVMADGVPWYLVSTDAGRGWVEYAALFRDPPIGGSTGRFWVDDIVELTESANLRTLPGVRSPVEEHAPAGTVGLVVAGPADADGYRWYRIMTGRRFAWVASIYLTWSDQPAPTRPAPATDLAVGDTVIVADGPLQVHRTAGLGDDVVAILATGETGTLVSGPVLLDSLFWFEMESASGTGWVAASYLERTEAPTPEPFGLGDTVFVDDGPVNLRQEPGTMGEIIGQLATGETVTITSEPAVAGGEAWYLVECALGSGWLAGSFLSRL